MKKNKAIFLSCYAAILSMALQGCSLPMPNTEELTQEVLPKKWSTEIASSVDGIETFWQRWNDPILLALIERAEIANPDVLSAIASVRSARAAQLSATAILWPTAEVATGADASRRNHKTTDGYKADIHSDWSFNLAGSHLSRADAKELRTEAREMTLAYTKNLVAAELAQAYINYRTAQEKINLAVENVSNAQKTAEVARWRAQTGIGANSELQDALQRLESAKARVPEIRASMNGYKNAIARLTATAADELDVEDASAFPVAPKGLAVSIPAETLMRRHDVLAALKNLEASARELKAAREDYFPTLTLRGAFGTDAESLSVLGSSATTLASLASSLSLPIINWGTLQAKEETASAELDENKSAYIAVIVKALEETDNAIYGIRSAEESESMLANALFHAEKAYQYAALEYRTGLGEYTMLLTAEKSLLNAREAVLANKADRSNQYVMLYRALGGAWGIDSQQEVSLQNE